MKRKQKEPVDIIPTVVPDSFDDVARTRQEYLSFATSLHVDVADGIFAPNKTWMPTPGDMLPEASTFMYEAHLMVDNALPVGVAYARAGARRIVAHVESFDHAESAREAFAMWRSAGAKEVGLGILLPTSLDALVPYVDLIDCVCVMSIASIGTQGIPFDERGVERIAELHKRYPALLIEVDGGVGKDTAHTLVKAGARRLCAGSAIRKSGNPEAAYRSLVEIVAK